MGAISRMYFLYLSIWIDTMYVYIDRVGLKNQLENISSNNTFLINEKCNEVECYEMNERTQGFYISIFT